MQDTTTKPSSQKPRIDIVEKYFYPVTGGIEVNMLETYSVLAEAGWEVIAHTSVDSLDKKNVYPKEEVIRGINVKRQPFGIFGYWPEIDFNTANVVALHNFNILPHFALMAYSLLRKWMGKKSYALMLTPHGGYNPEWSIFPPLQSIPKKFLHYTIGAWLVNHVVDGVRAVSNWEREEMIKKGLRPELIEVIDNGIEDEAYLDVEAEASNDIKDKVASFGRYIVQIGRIYPIKNYETTIRALALLPEDVKFIIAGQLELNSSGDYVPGLEKLILELGLKDRVLFIGVVRGVDKYYLIKKAQAMVHMALWESFCNVVHEGLSQGLVCIVANNTALPYLIKDGVNGYCVETKDYKQVASLVQYVLDHATTPEIVAMKERNRIYGLENSWRNVAERMDIFYRNAKAKVH